MSRRDGPTTMGPPFTVTELVRSGKAMNKDTRFERSCRLLADYTRGDAERTRRVRDLASENPDPFVIVQKLGLERAPVVAKRRGR